MDSRSWQAKLSSKADWYRFLSDHSKFPCCLIPALEGYLLPPYKQTSMRFIRDFLKGDKELIKAAEVRHFNVPLYAELSVASLLNQVKDDPDMMKYLPVYEGQRDPPDRHFFFGVLGSTAPEWLSGLIKHANRTRNKEDGGRPPEELIVVR